MSKFALITGALMLVASPAIAQTPSDSTAARDPKKSDDNRIICQKEEQIGTRLAPRKVCLTAKEWAERAKVGREETERVQQGTFRSGN